MELKISMDFDVDASDPDVEEQILDIAEEEGLKFTAVLADRLEAEGVTGVKVRLK